MASPYKDDEKMFFLQLSKIKNVFNICGHVGSNICGTTVTANLHFHSTKLLFGNEHHVICSL